MDLSDLTPPSDPGGSGPPATQAAERSGTEDRCEQDAAHETFEATFHLAALHLMCDPAGEVLVLSAIDRLDEFHRCLRDRHIDRLADRGKLSGGRTQLGRRRLIAAGRTLGEAIGAVGAIEARLEPPHDAPSVEALLHIDGATDCMARATRALAASAG